MNKPVAVLISDVHYNLTTLPLADAAMCQAIRKANELNVPLIVAGDLHDTKANLRGECMNAMIETFRSAREAYIMVGNHDKINEKSAEHSLNFLESVNVTIVDSPMTLPDSNFLMMLPYYSDYEEARLAVKKYGPNHGVLIMHQGLQGSNTGEYFVDASALRQEDVAGRKIISGHYHRRQTMKTPAGGTFDYIGNPYTLTFGEAKDPEKGFQILMSDGRLEFVPTKLRKHVVIELDDEFNVKNEVFLPRADDLVWIKIRGSMEKLSKITRSKVQEWLNTDNFKLDLIPDSVVYETTPQATKAELFDALIDNTDASTDRKANLKELWRKMLS